MERKILTEYEHLQYVHSCGKTGLETDSEICNKCKTEKPEVYAACVKDHGISGLDDRATEASIEKFLHSK